MLNIKIIAVGKLKEKFYIDAVAEYTKRLSAYAKIEIEEFAEAKRTQNPSTAETEAALIKEAELVRAKIPRGAVMVAMCIEGKTRSSEEFSSLISTYSLSGASKLCFLIGGSDGLHSALKREADLRLSMSEMTFPHHLARVMLLEQLYRAFKIIEGGKYHK